MRDRRWYGEDRRDGKIANHWADGLFLWGIWPEYPAPLARAGICGVCALTFWLVDVKLVAKRSAW